MNVSLLLLLIILLILLIWEQLEPTDAIIILLIWARKASAVM